jgi:DNA-directed RNA polymerase specialized sigma24 family protein
MIDSMPKPKASNDLGMGANASTTDASLLRRFKGGEADAATALYLRYAKRLQALAKSQTSSVLATRVDPEDVVQSVFRTFFRRASEGHYDIPEGEELWKLFLVISLNKVRTLGEFHRAGKRDVKRTVSATYVVGGAHGGHDGRGESDAEAWTTLRMVVDDLLGAISPTNRRIVELRIEGFHVAEIAEKTDRSKRTVERVLQGFRTQLQGVIHEETSDS